MLSDSHFDLWKFIQDIQEFQVRHRLTWKVFKMEIGIDSATFKNWRDMGVYPRVEIFLRFCDMMDKNPMDYLKR